MRSAAPGGRRRGVALLALGCLAALAACSGTDSGARGPDPAATVPALPGTTTRDPTTDEPTPSPTPGTTVSPGPSQSPVGGSAKATPTGSDAAPGRWPRPLGQPGQGDTVWAVYLAVGHSSGDRHIAAAVRQAAGVNYQAVVGDLACDHGGTEALRLDEYDYWTAATVYFASRSDAQAFEASYRARVARPLGVAKIGLGCLD